MQTKITSIKSLLFDGVFFSYFIMLIIYFVLAALHNTGASDFVPNQDAAILHMNAIYITVLVSFFLMSLASFALQTNKVATLGSVLFSVSKNEQAQPFFKSFWGIQLSITLLLTLIVSLVMTDFSIYELTDPNGFAGAVRLYDGLTNANFALLPTAITHVVETIFIAFLATAIALPIAFLLAFVSSKNIMTHPIAFCIYLAVRTSLNIARSVEPLIWALIFTVWVGVGPFAGMLALMFHTIASLAKQYSEFVEDVSEGPIDGVRSTGANLLQIIWYGIVPQIILPYISFTIYRWDTNVRMATVIGLVGGGGIGTLLIKYQGQAMWPEVGCIIFVIAAVVWIMDIASAYIREALR